MNRFKKNPCLFKNEIVTRLEKSENKDFSTINFGTFKPNKCIKTKNKFSFIIKRFFFQYDVSDKFLVKKFNY